MYKWLSKEEYKIYLSTFSCGDVQNCWESVFKMIALFKSIAREVADGGGYPYNYDEENAGTEFLKLVQKLPKDAQEIC